MRFALLFGRVLSMAALLALSGTPAVSAPGDAGIGTDARIGTDTSLTTSPAQALTAPGRSSFDGVVEAVRQTTLAAQVPGAWWRWP